MHYNICQRRLEVCVLNGLLIIHNIYNMYESIILFTVLHTQGNNTLP